MTTPAAPEHEIPKAYEPASVEAKWYARWLEAGCFTADPARVTSERPAFSIVIPPPNITGVLTLGHVLNNTIQDVLARRARQEGKEVLWLPGTDHAGTRHAKRRREDPAQDGKTHPARPRPRRVRAAHLGMEGAPRRHHHRTTQAPRLLVRLVARTLHPRRRLRRRRAGRVRGPAPEGLHLPRPAHGQLGPGGVDRPLGRGGHRASAEKHALPRALRTGRRTRAASWKSPRPARKRSWATPPWPFTRTDERYRDLIGQTASGVPSRARQSRSSATRTSTRSSARACSR